MPCLVLLILIGSQDPKETLEVNHIARAKIAQLAGKETEELFACMNGHLLQGIELDSRRVD